MAPEFDSDVHLDGAHLKTNLLSETSSQYSVRTSFLKGISSDETNSVAFLKKIFGLEVCNPLSIALDENDYRNSKQLQSRHNFVILIQPFV